MATFEEIYKTIGESEGGISKDKKDNGNYIGGKAGKGTFVATRYGITFDWWYENIRGKKGTPKESEIKNLIFEFNESIKNTGDAANIFKEVYIDRPRNKNLSLGTIKNPATKAFILDAMINQQFTFNNTDSNNIYEAIKKAGGKNTGDIEKDINDVSQAEFRKHFLNVRVARYQKSDSAKTHLNGWMNRLDNLSDTWADKGESSLLNPDFNFQDNIRGKDGDYKYINQEALKDSERIEPIVPPGPDKGSILSLEQKGILEKGREEEKKEELIERDAKALGLEESINTGLNKIGSSQLSPEYIRGVQEGTESVYDKNVKNAIMAMDPDNPLEIYKGKETYLDSAGNLAIVMPGMDKAGLQLLPWEEISKVQVGPEYKEPETPFVSEDPFIYDESMELDIEAAPEEEESDKDLNILKDNKGLMGSALGSLMALKAGAGLINMSEALKEIDTGEVPELSDAWYDYMERSKKLSESGLSPAELLKAKSDLNNTYSAGVKHVLRASGGNRGTYLANLGVLNANRIKGLVDLASKDAEQERKNMATYGTSLGAQEQMTQRSGIWGQKLNYEEKARQKALRGNIGNILLDEANADLKYAQLSNSPERSALIQNLKDLHDTQNNILKEQQEGLEKRLGQVTDSLFGDLRLPGNSENTENEEIIKTN